MPIEKRSNRRANTEEERNKLAVEAFVGHSRHITSAPGELSAKRKLSKSSVRGEQYRRFYDTYEHQFG
jgi:hypothetical protein